MTGLDNYHGPWLGYKPLAGGGTVYIAVGVPGLMFVVKEALAVVTYTQGEEMSVWVRVTATPLLGKAVCCLLVLLILNAQAIMANPYPDFSRLTVGDDRPLDETLTKALYVVIDAGNYSAIKCQHMGGLVPGVACRTSGRVHPTDDRGEELYYRLALHCRAWSGWQRGAPELQDGKARAAHLAHPAARALLLHPLPLELWNLSLTLLQLPMLMLGLPPANPHAMASRFYFYAPSLSIWLGVAAIVLATPANEDSRSPRDTQNTTRTLPLRAHGHT